MTSYSSAVTAREAYDLITKGAESRRSLRVIRPLLPDRRFGCQLLCRASLHARRRYRLDRGSAFRGIGTAPTAWIRGRDASPFRKCAFPNQPTANPVYDR